MRNTFVMLGLILSLSLMASAQEAKSVFNGKDTEGWKLRDAKLADTWVVAPNVALSKDDAKKLVAAGEGAGVLFRQPIAHGTDIFTVEQYGDIELALEFMVPKSSNSGIYLMGQYEVQVLDSFGKPDDKLSQGDVGAIYSAAKPSKNASKEPGTWQTFEIVFRAPRFGADGKKTENAKFLSVKLNGVEIQKDVEVKGPTGGQLPGGEKATGPLMFQGDHGIVAFRNVKIKPVK